MNAAITINDVSVVIKHKQILADVAAEIPTGRIVGLIGPSGAGKTSLVRTILGIQQPKRGEVYVLGRHAGDARLHTEIGYVTQAPSVYTDLTVHENVYYFASLLDLKEGEVKRVLEEVDLTAYEKQLVGNLSGGQRTRVSLAIALLGKPKLLILDEPTVGLDPVLREKIWKIFGRLSKSGVTLLVTSHIMDEAERCDELLFIRDGGLLISGTKQKILSAVGASSMDEAFLTLAMRQNDAS